MTAESWIVGSLGVEKVDRAATEAIALRLLGVPRTAAVPLARQLEVSAAEPLHEVRARVRSAGVDTWTAALGNRGASHHRVWSIIEGEA